MAMCQNFILLLLVFYLCPSVFTHRAFSRNHCNRKGKVVELKGQPFKIMSSYYQKCLIEDRGRYRPPSDGCYSVTLAQCDQNSTTGRVQLWQWTKNGQLQFTPTRKCLTLNGNNRLYLQSCGFARRNSSQLWECDGNFLKVKRKTRYLVPYWYSVNLHNFFGVTVRSSPSTVKYVGWSSITLYGYSGWTKHKTNVTICETSVVIL